MNYKVSVQDGKNHWIFVYVQSDEYVTVTKDEDEVCALHIGASTIEFEGDEIELEREV